MSQKRNPLKITEYIESPLAQNVPECQKAERMGEYLRETLRTVALVQLVVPTYPF